MARGGGRSGRGRTPHGYQGRGYIGGRGYHGGNYYHQGRGGYYGDQGHQGWGYYAPVPPAAPRQQGNYTPQAQYRRLNTPPSRVSTGSSASPAGRFQAYQGRGFAGRGRFQPVHVQQATHYVDDSSAYFADPGHEVHYSHHEPAAESTTQDNYLVNEDEGVEEDYQEEVDHEVYFQGHDDENYYDDGQW